MKAPPLSAQVVFRRVILRTQLLLTQPRTRSQGHLRCALLFFFQAEDGIRDRTVTGVQTCALPISRRRAAAVRRRAGSAGGATDGPSRPSPAPRWPAASAPPTASPGRSAEAPRFRRR